MILTADIGNTNIVIGMMDENHVHFSGRIASDRKKTADQFAIEIKTMMDIYNVDMSKISGSIISSVVPQLTIPLKSALMHLLRLTPFVVGSGIKTGLNILTDQPNMLGSDLVVNAVAALAQYKPPMMIFDLGTATTCSVIDASGNYIGSIIYPGVKTSFDALSQNASQLPYISYEPPKNIIGKNTVDSMKSGAIYGSAAMLDGLIDKIIKDQGHQMRVIATGGLAKCVVPYCEHEVIYDEDLLSKGLWYIYQKNCKIK